MTSRAESPVPVDAPGPVNLADLLTRTAAEAGPRVALIDAETERRVTWDELEDEVSRVATGLSELGLVAGYRVVLCMTNCVEFVATYLAALRARLVAVPVNPRGGTGELARMIVDCGARAVVCEPKTVSQVRAAVGGVADALAGEQPTNTSSMAVPRVIVCRARAIPGELTYDEVARRTARAIPLPEDPESLAVLLYTSGTSGRPRAAMLSHRALVANIEQAAQVRPPMVTGDDVVLGVLPLFHVYGLNAVLGQAVRQGARIVLVDGFDVGRSLDVIEAEAVSVLPVAPPVFAHWASVENLASRLSGVRLVLSGSAPLSAELVASFTERTGIDVHQGYGLTEAAPVVTSTLCSPFIKAGSVGSALPGIEVRLVDETGHEPDGEDAGEIAIRGQNLFTGYWPDGSGGPDEDGWYATGDVGFLDPDGDLFLVDRLEELVIVSGFNVYPREVEEVIAELGDVAEAAVIGSKDGETGEAVVAFVKRAPEAFGTDDELVATVLEHCGTRLARFKQPKTVHVVGELPHTVTGKVAKGRLRGVEQRRSLGLLE